jgi:protein SCO1/2
LTSLCRLLPGLLLLASAVHAETSAAVPENLQGVSFEQRLGEPLPLDAPFVDEVGEPVLLGRYFGQRPVVLALVYYDCPMLCTLVLNGTASALKGMTLKPGEDFDIVVVSFDATETAQQAAAAKALLLERYGKPETAAGFHFLTGSQESITRLTEAVGFRFRRVEGSDEFAHAAGLVVATVDGKAARYLYGVEYPPRDLRLALVEASENRIGSAVDQLLLYCYRYDPSTGRYSAAVMNLVRAGGGLTVLLLGVFIFVMLRRDKGRALERHLGTV